MLSLGGGMGLAYAAPSSIQQSQGKAAGTVVDSKGEPVVGVSVVVLGTNNGTFTDLDGKFTLSNVASGATIQFSSVGFQTMEVKWTGSDLQIVLADDANFLEEVVVVGYGTVRKADLASAISVVDNKAFKEQPITRASEALQGRVSGVMVENSNIPGGSMKIRVRGANSINKSNDPLYVVDGVFRDNLDGINPDDIQSMQVLKDASSTAIYGSRGANGVVLVSTKTGRSGHNEIVFDASVGISNVYKKYNLLNAYEFASAYNTYKTAGTFSDAQLEAFKSGKAGTDWQNTIFRTGLTQNYKVSATTGNEFSTIYVSGNLMKNTGVVIGTDMTRYQARANFDTKVKKWFSIAGDINVSRNISHGADFSVGKGNYLWSALQYSPVTNIFDENGQLLKDKYNMLLAGNPYALVVNKNETMRDNLTARTDLKFFILPGLTFVSTNALSYTDSKNYGFGYSQKNFDSISSLQNGDWYTMMLQTTNNLTYVKSFGKHNITATLAQEAISYDNRNMRINGRDLSDETVGWYGIEYARIKDAYNGYSASALLSGLGRLIYNYDERYLLSATFRADGSSKFLKNKWGFFPSVAAAWTVSNESFMKDVKAIQDLKLRASYGIVGSEAIGSYETLGTRTSRGNAWGTETWAPGFIINDVPNELLTWEKTHQFDLGLEFALLQRRLNVGVDFFYKRTVDALVREANPKYIGGSDPWVNKGSVENMGVDLSLSANIINAGDFSWNSALNLTWLRNRVLKITGQPGEFLLGAAPAGGMVDDPSRIYPGHPMGLFYGYVWDGLDENKADKYKDLNGDNKIDANDKMIIGKALPDVTFGFNNDFSYKNFSANLFITGSFGGQRMNLMRFTMASINGDSNFVSLKDAIDKAGQGFYTAVGVTNNNQAISTKWLESASYVRVENLTLAYTLPKKTTKFADVRFSLNCQNLFTFTKYSGIDPTSSSFARSDTHADINAGYDMGGYPTPRTFTFGVRMTF